MTRNDRALVADLLGRLAKSVSERPPVEFISGRLDEMLERIFEGECTTDGLATKSAVDKSRHSVREFMRGLKRDGTIVNAGWGYSKEVNHSNIRVTYSSTKREYIYRYKI